MEGRLRAVGITTPEQLHATGAVEAYVRIRTLNPRVINRMALYALWGAIHNEHCLWLSSDVKNTLNSMLQQCMDKK